VLLSSSLQRHCAGRLGRVRHCPEMEGPWADLVGTADRSVVRCSRIQRRLHSARPEAERCSWSLRHVLKPERRRSRCREYERNRGQADRTSRRRWSSPSSSLRRVSGKEQVLRFAQDDNFICWTTTYLQMTICKYRQLKSCYRRLRRGLSLSPTVCRRMKFVAPEVNRVPATRPSTSPLRIIPFGRSSRSAVFTIPSAEFHWFL